MLRLDISPLAGHRRGLKKARIVDIAEVRKSPEERETEQLLNQLSPGKAIEITLTENETPKKIIRLYRHVSKRMRKMVRIETKDTHDD